MCPVALILPTESLAVDILGLGIGRARNGLKRQTWALNTALNQTKKSHHEKLSPTADLRLDSNLTCIRLRPKIMQMLVFNKLLRPILLC